MCRTHFTAFSRVSECISFGLMSYYVGINCSSRLLSLGDQQVLWEAGAG